MRKNASPRLAPVLIAGLGAAALLKILNVAVGFSSSEAATPAALTPPPLAIALENIERSTDATISNAPLQKEALRQEPTGETERRILERLAERRRTLEVREQEIKVKEAVIAAAEARLKEQFSRFEEERANLTALREERDAADSEEIAALVSAYERMRARDAAAIFNELDDDIMLSVASKMRTQALAGVLAEMQPEKARMLTILLAKRDNALGEPEQ
ncbi:MAG: hypothetical protein AAGD92_15055 [Pseudomonadota bacterium]